MNETDSELGEIHRTGDTVEIVFHRRFDRTIEQVWAAMSVPERIADWFTEVHFARLAPGEPFVLTFPAPHGSAEGQLVDVNPPHRLAWTWPQPDGSQSTVTFELQRDGDGCRLTLTESGLTVEQGADNAGGWHAHLQAVLDAIDGVPTAWETLVGRAKAVEEIYRGRAPA